MSIEEYVELLKYIQKNHSWEHMSKVPKGNMLIKYIRSSVDTRQGFIWQVIFNDVCGSIDGKEEHIFDADCNYNLKDRIYKFLKDKE
jgi:hypothetical protein